MEAMLSTWFELAEIWAAVMLIDEADIYLETRTTSDLQRNSLVSGECLPDLSCDQILTDLRSLPTSHGVLPRHPLPHDQPSRSYR